MYQTLDEYESALESYERPSCNRCGRFISKKRLEEQLLYDGKDVFRGHYCVSCDPKFKK